MTLDQKLNDSNKILFVDDELGKGSFKSSIEIGLGKFVKEKEYTLDFAAQEHDALKKIANNNYRIVFTDGCLFNNGHGDDSNYLGGLNVAKAAKEKGMYVAGISSNPKEFGDIANNYLDINYTKFFDFEILKRIIEEKPSRDEFEKYKVNEK